MHKTLLVTGSRNWTDAHTIGDVLAKAIDAGVTELLHGACPKGADAIADRLAFNHGLRVRRMPAHWETEGKAAGFNRNVRMLRTRPDYVVGFWIPPSRGTAHCLLGALKLGLPTVTYIQEGPVVCRRVGDTLLGRINKFSPKSKAPDIT